MLFATSRRHKDRVSAYEQLGKPDWHSGGEAANDYYNTQPNAYAELRDFHLQGDGHGYHLRYRQTRQAALNKISIPFAEFPALESRNPPALEGQQGLFELLHLLACRCFWFTECHPGYVLTCRECCTDVGFVSSARPVIFAVRLFHVRDDP